MFGVEILVYFKVGSGQQLKSVLSTTSTPIRATGLCNTKAHKDWVMGNLIEYARKCRLVSVADAPKKPQALLDWEHKATTPKAAKAATSGVPMPAPSALPKASVPPVAGGATVPAVAGMPGLPPPAGGAVAPLPAQPKAGGSAAGVAKASALGTFGSAII